MKTVALIERGGDGSYCIYTPNLKSTIIGEGASVSEAKADFENSVEEVLASFEEDEDKGEFSNLSFEYKYDLASLFNYFDFINVSKFAKWIGINPSLLRQYKNGSTYISEERMRSIETSIHSIANELRGVTL